MFEEREVEGLLLDGQQCTPPPAVAPSGFDNTSIVVHDRIRRSAMKLVR